MSCRRRSEVDLEKRYRYVKLHLDAISTMELHDDTVINVASLLKEPSGASRTYDLDLTSFSVDPDMVAKDVHGSVRLVQVAGEIVASVTADGDVELDCQRCLDAYRQPFSTKFTEEYRATVDIHSGGTMQVEEVDERSPINEAHEVDIGDVLRQEILVALPMRLVCGDDCPGPDVPVNGKSEPVDERFAALADLLDSDDERA